MNNQKTFFFAIYSILLIITIILSLILFSEYRYFKREAYDLCQVKDAYYQHVEILNRRFYASMVVD